MLTALWRVLPLAPHLLKEESCVKLSSRPLLDLVPSVSCFVPLRLSDLVLKLFIPATEGALPFQVSLCRITQNTYQEVNL